MKFVGHIIVARIKHHSLFLKISCWLYRYSAYKWHRYVSIHQIFFVELMFNALSSSSSLAPQHSLPLLRLWSSFSSQCLPPFPSVYPLPLFTHIYTSISIFPSFCTSPSQCNYLPIYLHLFQAPSPPASSPIYATVHWSGCFWASMSSSQSVNCKLVVA